jgi:predicted  nucleic acid-binding Zn-ribbon protein
MSGETLGWSGDSNNPVNLAVNIGKLQTFCRNLEDRIEKNESSKDELTKVSVQLDELKAKTSELKARMTSVEDLIDEVESAKKVLKMLNPKTLIAGAAIIMGGSVGGNTMIESFDGQEQVIKQEVDQQDQKIDLLLKKINDIQEEKKD